MEENLVSIIIPIYNSELYLETCLNSLISQSYSNFEVIAINDGSTDNSTNILNVLKKIDSRIRIFTTKNYGVSHARNFALNKCKGDYLIFVDSDDVVEPNYIEKLVELLKKTNSDLASCNYNHSPNAEINNNSDYSIICNKLTMYDKVLNDPKMSGFLWNKIFDSNIIKSNNLKFDEKIHINEDLLFICEYLKFCKSIVVSEEILYHYIIRKNSALNNSFSIKQISKIYSIKKLVDIYLKFDNINIDNILYDFVFSAYKTKYLTKKYNIVDRKINYLSDYAIDNYYKIVIDNSSLKKIIKLLTMKHFPRLYDFFKTKGR